MPKAVQLLGSEPNLFEYTCKSRLMHDFDVIDINMGCPVPNVIKSRQGCALMAQPSKAAKMIEACKRSGKIVTVKCRLGLDDDSIIAAEFAKLCENAGADLITIHGRTRNMMYAGETRLEHIAAAKSAVRIPVIANGGIFSQLTGKEITQNKYQILMEQISFNELFECENGILLKYHGTETVVTVPEDIHTIGDATFKGRTKIEKIILPESVKHIGNHAFKGCKKLLEINYPIILEMPCILWSMRRKLVWAAGNTPSRM